MPDRRSFLQVLGLAPAIAVTAPAEVLGMGGARGRLGRYAMGTLGAEVGASCGPLRAARAMPIAGRTSLGGIDHLLGDRLSNGLDPDLIANRSFSLAAKIMVQRERDLVRAPRRVVSRGLYDG